MSEEPKVHLEFYVTFRDMKHFHRVVKILNYFAGHSRENWTTEGKVAKKIKSGKQPRTKIIIFNSDVDDLVVSRVLLE